MYHEQWCNPSKSKHSKTLWIFHRIYFTSFFVQLFIEDAPVKAKQCGNTGCLNFHSYHVSDDFLAACRSLSQPKYFWVFFVAVCFFICMCNCVVVFFFFQNQDSFNYSTSERNTDKNTAHKIVNMFVPRYFMKHIFIKPTDHHHHFFLVLLRSHACLLPTETWRNYIYSFIYLFVGEHLFRIRAAAQRHFQFKFVTFSVKYLVANLNALSIWPQCQKQCSLQYIYKNSTSRQKCNHHVVFLRKMVSLDADRTYLL